MTKVKPDWEGFGRAIMDDHFCYHDIDGQDRHELALKFNLLVEVPGGFDPENESHRQDNEYDAEKGDAWFEYNFDREAT